MKPTRSPTRGPVLVVADALGLDLDLGVDRSCLDGVSNTGRIQRGARSFDCVDALDAFVIRYSALADEPFEDLEASDGHHRAGAHAASLTDLLAPSATPTTTSVGAEALRGADAESPAED